MLIYDCDDFQVIQRHGGGDLLLVTFSSLGMFNAKGSMADGETFWGRHLVERQDLAAIGFVAKHRNWFCSPKMPEACELVRAISRHRAQCVAYGSSMGGYAALRWGKASGAGTVVAFAPQISIEPEIVASFDRRYEWCFRSGIHAGMQLGGAVLADRSYVFFDPFCEEDRQHAVLVKGLHSRSVDLIPLYFCGHECIRAFANSEIAARLIGKCLAGDTADIKRMTTEVRRASRVRRVELINRVFAQWPDTAVRLFLCNRAYFEVSQRSAFLAKAMAQTSNDRRPLDARLLASLQIAV